MIKKRIAIVGGGISGLSAAWALRHTADVTLFEARERVGGHSHTMTLDYDGKSIDVDVGFIVYNPLNYPNLIAMFDALEVETARSDMSFAVSDPQGYEWASTASGLFADKRNLFSPKYISFLRTILKFNDQARDELASGRVENISLGSWLSMRGYSQTFLDNYILPMGAAIWSTPEREMLDYPAKSFFQFFDNHRLMHKERPKWRTVAGGSKQYVSALLRDLGRRVRPAAPVANVSPFGSNVKVELETGASEIFDDVIMACHSDQSSALLGNGFDDRRDILKSVRYRPNRIYVHRDASLMPKRKAAWAAWNVLKQEGEDVCLTYWMNRLQNIPNVTPIFVTLNPNRRPDPELTFNEFEFAHPQFDAPAEAAVRMLKLKQGESGLWLAGAWMGSGFHEDGLKSGLSAALSLGGQVPWEAVGVDVIKPPQRVILTDASAKATA